MQPGTDSQRAAAMQLIVLTLVADGELANREIDAIDRHRVAELIGVDRDVLIQAVIDHCRELLAKPAGAQTERVTEPESFERLLDQISDARLQKLTCRAMLVLSKADGDIALAEQTLLRHALTRWGLTLDSVGSGA